MKTPIFISNRWLHNLGLGFFLGFVIGSCLFGTRCIYLVKKHRQSVNMSLKQEINALKSMDNLEARQFLQKKIKRRIAAYKFMKSSSPRFVSLLSVDDAMINEIEEELVNEN